MVRNLVDVTGKLDWYDGPKWGPYSVQSSNHTSRRTKRGDVTPTLPSGSTYWRPTPYYGVSFTGSSTAFDFDYLSYGQVRRRYGSSSDSMFGPNYPLTGVGSDWLPSLTATAALASRCDAAVRKGIVSQDWALGQTLGELPETIEFIVKTVRRVARLYRAVRHGDLRDILSMLKKLKGQTEYLPHLGEFVDARLAYAAWVKGVLLKRGKKYLRKQLTRDTAAFWLEISFAWRPLIQDVYNACQVLSNGLSNGPGFVVSHRESEALQPPFRGGSTVVIDEEFDGKREVTVEVGFRPTNSYLWDLQKLGLTNPASLAWELIPMSFVVDWFVPVGNFLEGLQQPFGVTFSYGYRTTCVKWTHMARFHNAGTSSPVLGGVLPVITGSMFSFRRDTYIAFPVPVPTFRGFGNLGIGQTISAAALIRQFA